MPCFSMTCSKAALYSLYFTRTSDKLHPVIHVKIGREAKDSGKRIKHILQTCLNRQAAILESTYCTMPASNVSMGQLIPQISLHLPPADDLFSSMEFHLTPSIHPPLISIRARSACK